MTCCWTTQSELAGTSCAAVCWRYRL